MICFRLTADRHDFPQFDEPAFAQDGAIDTHRCGLVDAAALDGRAPARLRKRDSAN
jgi:hypothetical protein